MKDLYNKYLAENGFNGKILKFHGVDDTVYNTTPPLWLNVSGEKKRIIAGRVERLDEWAHSRVMFFEEIAPFEYALLKKSPIITGEDPSITTVNGKIVLSAVLVKALFPKTGQYLLETVYYTGNDIHELEFQPGWSLPGKDNRLVEIDDGIAVATRPQGKIGGKGTIAYVELPSLNDLSAENVRNAQLLKGVFGSGWGGANELHWLPKTNSIGVVCHGAFQANGKKIYFPGWFRIIRDPKKKKILRHTKLSIIATRQNFPPEYAKMPELSECVFTSGITFEPGHPPMLYAGLGDYCEGASPLQHKEIRELY